MKFRNYCAVIMGKFDKTAVLEEIKRISENPVNSIDTGGIMIATFTSVLEPAEIGGVFDGLGLNNLVFDLNKSNSSVHMQNPMLQEGLFGIINAESLDDMTSRLIRDISMSSTTKNHSVPPKAPKVKKQQNNRPTEEDIEKMSVKEKENLLNQYIDNGLENLTDSDKKIIELLAK